MKISLDTNILIDDPKVVFDESREFILSFTVIRELDKLKRNPDLKRSAQTAIRSVWSMYRENKIEILNIPNLLGDSPDEKIIQDTKDANASILSNDIAVRIIAKAHGVDISEYELEDVVDRNYKGYVTVLGDIDYETNYVQIKEMQLEEFNERFQTDLKENMYCIVDRVTDKDDIWLNRSGTVIRISQSMKPFKDAGVLITPLDSMQMCALHAVFDPEVPLVVIDGELGTGKTMLVMAGVLARTCGQKRYMDFDTVYVSKPPVSTNKDLYTGYKPGSRDEKLGGHLGGIKGNLEFLLDKRGDRKAKLKEGEEAKTNSDLVWDEYFESKDIDEAQGDSLHNSAWIIDEWQLLDEEAAKMVMSRISDGGKIILVGDTAGQTYGMNRANEGFKPLFEWLGKAPEFSYIKLEEIYRSPLAKFVAKVYV